VFFIAAAIYLFGLFFYAIFASGEKQPWADGNLYLDQKKEDEENNLLSQTADEDE